MKNGTTFTATKRKRHKWGGSPERTIYETVYICVVCGLNRINDHNAWPVTTHYRYAKGESLSVMPECDIVE
jgi:hypothetical protein